MPDQTRDVSFVEGRERGILGNGHTGIWEGMRGEKCGVGAAGSWRLRKFKSPESFIGVQTALRSWWIKWVCCVPLLVVSANEGTAAGVLKHGTGYYVGPAGAGAHVAEVTARRYELGLTGLRNPDAARVKELNPSFQWLVYNSITDNTVGPGVDDEHALVQAVARSYGWDPEIAYLHYFDDTIVKLRGEEIFVPGWTGGSARTMSEARVPVYEPSGNRNVVQFSTPQARMLHREVVLRMTIDATFAGTDLHPDGILLDNSAWRLYNVGEVLRGGMVLEAPDHPQIGSPEFQDWHWFEGLGPFLSELKDTLESSTVWAPDGMRKTLAINVSNTWTDSYLSLDVADILVMESQYDPVRNAGDTAVPTAWIRDRMAEAAGIRTFYVPFMTSTVPGKSDTISVDEALLGSLAWHLVTRTSSSLLFLSGGRTNPAVEGFLERTWAPCVDVVDSRFGAVAGDPYEIARGKDPIGNVYTVWARDYENGLALIRNRGNWKEGLEAATSVEVSLPAPLALISPEGMIGPTVRTISMRNGTGALLIGNPKAIR